jgi:GTP-binding protein HflX
LFGSGKVAEIEGLFRAEGAELVIVDHPLTPVQQRNLETAWGAKVLDRTGLILEIFGARARTREGRLQVELAHLVYQKSRLVRSWTHLERQRGGFGFLGGPGETQIETDRRIIGDRIEMIRSELEQVRRTRALHRKSRARVPYPAVALVGYTNAGKSTLMRALTGNEALVADKLFATLDTTVRALQPPTVPPVLVSDTVGFIKNLPHGLVASFKSTLDEALEASLLAHVVDASDPGYERQLAVTEEVLDEIGAKAVPRQLVFNKIDRAGEGARELEAKLLHKYPGCIVMSARREEDVARLRQAIAAFFQRDLIEAELFLPWAAQKARGEVFSTCEVLEERTDGEGALLRIRGAPETVKRLRARFGRVTSK